MADDRRDGGGSEGDPGKGDPGGEVPGSAGAEFEPPLPMSGHRRRLPDEGALEVVVYDEQRQHPVDLGRWRLLAEHVVEAEGIRGEAELSVIFVDELAMTELNQHYLGEEGPTDVLSFPIDDDLAFTGRWPDGSTPGPRREPGDVPLLLGDVVICPSIAARNAPTHAGTYDDEIALLLVHGILHILGMDHATQSDESAMQARERQYLERFHRPLPETTWAPQAAPQ
ncbi:MAG: rRNA maturation RNase YbeY [Acidimicrobiales bacterium]